MTTDPFLELIRRVDRSSKLDVALGPPAFAVPAKAAAKLGWGLCAGCTRGVEPGTAVVCHGRRLHPGCAVVEAVELRSAA